MSRYEDGLGVWVSILKLSLHGKERENHSPSTKGCAPLLPFCCHFWEQLFCAPTETFHQTNHPKVSLGTRQVPPSTPVS